MSSPSLLSTLSASRPLPIARTPSHSSSPSPELTTTSSSSPSLYVTFKVLRLLDTFRTRVRKRVRSDRRVKKATSKRTTKAFCQGLERQAFEEIDRYLGRKTTERSRKRSYPANEGGEKLGEGKRATVVTAGEQDQDPLSSSVQWLLDELERSANSESRSLIAVAKDHQLFLTRKADLHIERPSLKDVIQLLVVVKDLLSTLRRPTRSRAGVKTLVEGNELLDLTLDETVNANLEHLLLCLKDQLIRLLVSKLVDLVQKQLVECQRDQNRHCENWFFEFPDSRHPLSTTWPWSIRPSLAVLWGVCWMFYDFSEQYDFPEALSPAALAQIGSVLQHFNRQQQQSPQSNYCHLAQVNLQPAVDPRSPRSTPTSHSLFPNMAQPQHHRGLNVPFTSAGPPDQAAHASAHRVTAYNSYSAAPPASAHPYLQQHHQNLQTLVLPEENLASHHLSGSNFPDSTYAADIEQWEPEATPGQQFVDASWQQFQAQDLPPHSRNFAPPGIRLITDPGILPALHQQPQAYHNSTSVSSASTLPLRESPYNRYGPNLSPLDAQYPHMHPPDEKMQNTPPRSPHAIEAASMGEQLSRKRSHEQMAAESMRYVAAPVNMAVQPNLDGQSRAGSVSSQVDLSPPIKNIAIKRGNPPTNAQGKFACDYSEECAGLIFDRKCEWSKHMDKHDRPYRCPHEECAKLQGFTYSGGLLRHEREVHNKHGGPKSKLVCPHVDCKRHTGKGFTRKENLNEHVRRVHENKENQSQSQGPSQIKRDDNIMPHPVENVETPYYTQIDPEDPDSPAQKRRKYPQTQGMSDRSASEGVDDLRYQVLRHENQRLEEQNRHKDDMMQQMRSELENLRQSVVFLQQQVQAQGQGQV
ncbi:uncharacterized protein LTR77_004991 [Saxophila tyrrhenica]|uniref:C2H2-type domain-containing protein n=1 Tax=Saxophila tyrrhenica TaxID=1690608 RepID=A0AAV9PET1_9PEZI|nr:hypothetical protein LTR77_004991 [Saxophila tyrrhenica]